MSEHDEAPPRLVDSEGPAGDCLRQALEEDEHTMPRFVLLREKRLRRLRLQRGAWLLGAAALALLIAPKLKREPPQASISAEQQAAIAKVENVAPQVLPTVVPRAEPPAPAKPTASIASSTVTRRAPVVAITESEKAPRAEAAEPPRPAPGSAKACADLLRSSGATPALSCYQALASGSGMSAELALFEQARLEGKVLRQPARALATLEAYRRRFPQGSLRAEVMLAQIDWLITAGDKARARALVDEALASGLLGERAAELKRLRGTLERAE